MKLAVLTSAAVLANADNTPAVTPLPLPKLRTLRIAGVAHGRYNAKAVTITNMGCASANLKHYSLDYTHNLQDLVDELDEEGAKIFYKDTYLKNKQIGAGEDPLKDFETEILPTIGLAKNEDKKKITYLNVTKKEWLKPGESITLCNAQCKEGKDAEKCEQHWTDDGQCQGEFVTGFSGKINHNGDDLIDLVYKTFAPANRKVVDRYFQQGKKIVETADPTKRRVKSKTADEKRETCIRTNIPQPVETDDDKKWKEDEETNPRHNLGWEENEWKCTGILRDADGEPLTAGGTLFPISQLETVGKCECNLAEHCQVGFPEVSNRCQHKNWKSCQPGKCLPGYVSLPPSKDGQTKCAHHVPTPTTLEFGGVTEGARHTKAITLTNSGCEEVSLSMYSLKFYMNVEGARNDPTKMHEVSGEPTRVYRFNGKDTEFGEKHPDLLGNDLKLAPGGSVSICHKNCDATFLAKWEAACNAEKANTLDELNEDFDYFKKHVEKKGRTLCQEWKLRNPVKDSTGYIGTQSCERSFASKCEVYYADYDWQILVNGDDRIELWMQKDEDGEHTEEMVDLFAETWPQVSNQVCLKEESGGSFNCEEAQGNWKDGFAVDFPTPTELQTCPCRCVNGVAENNCENSNMNNCKSCTENFFLKDRSEQPGMQTCQYMGAQSVEELNAMDGKSPIFNINMFSENCNPKECDEWTCDQWCACWENPFVPMIFDSLQYSAALSQVCPDVGPACEC